MPWNLNWREARWDEPTLGSMYKKMALIREFEIEGERRYTRGDFIGPYHSSIGQEATCVGVMHSMTRGRDYMTSHHRSHGHQIAIGADVDALAAEVWGKSTGICKGKGGSMHLADFAAGSLGASGLLGGGMGIAIGAALVQVLEGTGGVVVCVFGDGAVNEGIVHEAMNWASVWSLPIVFVCENNQYALTMWYRDTTSSEFISKRAAAYNMPGWTVDGQNVLEVATTAEHAVTRARSGAGPSIVECLTYRFSEHSLRMVIPKDREGALERVGTYRPQWEVEQWLSRDPLRLMRQQASTYGVDPQLFDDADAEAKTAAVNAWSFAEASPWPETDEIWTDTWPEPVPIHQRLNLA